MNKDYTIWMPVKKEINNSDLRPMGCKEREIWICNLGENIGFEEDGKGNEFTRPVLILKVFNRKFCHIVPLSTTDKRGKFYYPFDGKTGKTSVALLSQSKPIDTARLSRKVGTMEEKEFEKVKKLIEEILF
jgi:mRNA interferase MazF